MGLSLRQKDGDRELETGETEEAGLALFSDFVVAIRFLIGKLVFIEE